MLLGSAKLVFGVSKDDDSWLAGEPNGATPLTADDREFLKPNWVGTRAELNAVEQNNILKAQLQPKWNRMSTSTLLDDLTIRNLHESMFNDVWDWAGKYRSRELTIGVAPDQVSVAVRQLVENAKLWFNTTDPIEIDQTACKVHHRLVEIHPFNNGNGRFAREYTNLILHSMKQDKFTWGIGLTKSSVRESYILALREADKGNFDPLYKFVRS